MHIPRAPSNPEGATGVIVFADGRTVWGTGFGSEGQAVGELCFNTAMTGYQEVMTDPSYARQIITFTFPHIGNVGANEEDVEATDAHALGCLVREAVTSPSNFRSQQDFPTWMAATGRIGICGVDTRALTRLVRREGPPTIAIAHNAKGNFDLDALQQIGRRMAGPRGHGPRQGGQPRPAGGVERRQVGAWRRLSRWAATIRRVRMSSRSTMAPSATSSATWSKPARGLPCFRQLQSFDEVMSHQPDGFFLSNGPGDPAATGEYAVPVIKQMLETKKPLFGICLGHQMLALAVGGKTAKMFQGHRGANHPVKRLADGRVEITSMNHGFAVERDGLPDNVRETHVSLFDNSNCGIELIDRPAFSVQYHPEASPGPQDSFYLFQRFVAQMKEA